MNEPAPTRRWVVDTNVLVSRMLLPRSVPADAVRRAMQLGNLVFTEQTERELASVLLRAKFDVFASRKARSALLAFLAETAERASVTRPIRACRDPKDDKFLEAAVHGDADALITGDQDLLALHPFHGVPILTPQAFLAQHAPAS